MKFLYLELNYFKRFALNNIKLFSMNFDSALQIILGTNGSGKSSLLEQLTPLPPSHKDFEPNGSKKLFLEHLGKNYELLFYNDSGAKYEFIVDGENLNPGRTITVQKDLVKKYFNFTSAIQSLQTGKDNFTQLSPVKRKDWFIDLCETNYDYAIGVFLKIKERHRDTVGAIKQLHKKLVEEQNKALQEKELFQLQEDARQLYEIIQFLMEHRSPAIMPQSQYTQDLISLEKTIEVNTHKLLQFSNHIKTPYSREKISDILNTNLSVREGQLQALMSQTGKYLSEVDEHITLLLSADNKSIEDIDKKTQELQKSRQDITTMVAQVRYPRNNRDSLISVQSTITDITTTLPVRKEHHNTANFQLNTQRDTSIKNRLQQVFEKIIAIKNKINHQTNHQDQKEVNCPQCKFKFKPSLFSETLQQLSDSLEQLEAEQEALRAQSSQVKVLLDSYLSYRSDYMQLAAVLKTLPDLKDYWTILMPMIESEPSKVVYFIQEVLGDLDKHITIQEIDQELENLNTTKLKLQTLGSNDLKVLQQQQAKHKADYAKYITALENTAALIKHYRTAEYALIKVDQLKETISKQVEQFYEISQEKIESLRRDTLNETIRGLQSQLGSIEHALHQAKTQATLVDSYEKQLKSLQTQEKYYSLALKALSPTEGLIAKGLHGFIKKFISQMNAFIEQVWNYPLQIQFCDLENNDTIELSYYFPVTIGDKEHTISDVSEGSKGMVTIFDLAFKIIAMKYLSQNGGVLHLDEYGVNLDEKHRVQATEMIKNLLDQKVFDQIFLVSHFDTMYTALSNAQVCVLNNLNICVPRGDVKVNEHVVMS